MSMDETVFGSRLSIEEIEENFADADFFSGLSEGLAEAFRYERGVPCPGTVVHKRDIPEP